MHARPVAVRRRQPALVRPPPVPVRDHRHVRRSGVPGAPTSRLAVMASRPYSLLRGGTRRSRALGRRGRLPALFAPLGDHAVADDQHPIHRGRGGVGVGRPSRSRARSSRWLAQQAQDLVACRAVEIAGRLVGEQELRAAWRGRVRSPHAAARRPTARSAGDPLVPASPTPSSISVVRSSTSRRGRWSAISGSATLSRADMVGSRLKNWKTNPMWRRRNAVASSAAEVAQALPVHEDLAHRRQVEACDDVEERRLARSARPHDARSIPPGATLNVTSRRACTSAEPRRYDRETPRTSSTPADGRSRTFALYSALADQVKLRPLRVRSGTIAPQLDDGFGTSVTAGGTASSSIAPRAARSRPSRRRGALPGTRGPPPHVSAGERAARAASDTRVSSLQSSHRRPLRGCWRDSSWLRRQSCSSQSIQDRVALGGRKPAGEEHPPAELAVAQRRRLEPAIECSAAALRDVVRNATRIGVGRIDAGLDVSMRSEVGRAHGRSCPGWRACRSARGYAVISS